MWVFPERREDPSSMWTLPESFDLVLTSSKYNVLFQGSLPSPLSLLLYVAYFLVWP